MFETGWLSCEKFFFLWLFACGIDLFFCVELWQVYLVCEEEKYRVRNMHIFYSFWFWFVRKDEKNNVIIFLRWRIIPFQLFFQYLFGLWEIKKKCENIFICFVLFGLKRKWEKKLCFRREWKSLRSHFLKKK